MLNVSRDNDVLTEYVRQALRRQITKQYVDSDMSLKVLTLDPSIEEQLRESVQQSEFGSYLALDPDIAQQIMEKLTHYYQTFNQPGNYSYYIMCSGIKDLF